MNKPSARSTQSWLLWSMLGASLFSGCSLLPGPKVARDAAAGFYQSASLTYRVDAGKLQQPLDVIRVEGQRVSYEQVASSPLSDQSIGTLSLVYPHPAGRDGFAQAKFTLESIRSKSTSASSWNPFSKSSNASRRPEGLSSSQPEIHEVWVLDLPRDDSDQYFKLLSTQSFYNTERSGSAGAQLSVKINGREVRKPWDQIPELNALVHRVRREGRLAVFSHPDVLSGAPSQAISSTRFYAELLANDGESSSQTDLDSLAASPFSMPVAVSRADSVARLPSVPQ